MYKNKCQRIKTVRLTKTYQMYKFINFRQSNLKKKQTKRNKKKITKAHTYTVDITNKLKQ